MDNPSLACVVGARPNFVKIGPVLTGLREAVPHVKPILVHTGQHYDVNMSDRFFQQLKLPDPDVYLAVGSGQQGEQTATTLSRYEAWLLQQAPRPMATLVVGDVNSTLACALASAKLQIPVIHVEAGLRSFDRSMPEELNRVLTDALADLLLVSERSGVTNLLREGRPKSAIRLVGNVMIDVVRQQLPTAMATSGVRLPTVSKHGYAVWTMHRPANVDDLEILDRLVSAMVRIADWLPIVLPIHPRTESRLKAAGLWETLEQQAAIRLLPPLGYREFLALTSRARVIITDSGGLQEESTALNIPCLTLRTNTERPVTVEEGTSTLVGQNSELLMALVEDVLCGRYKTGRCPELWDGQAGARVGAAIGEFLSASRPERSPSEVFVGSTKTSVPEPRRRVDYIPAG